MYFFKYFLEGVTIISENSVKDTSTQDNQIKLVLDNGDEVTINNFVLIKI